jgi:hypothetical protein
MANYTITLTEAENAALSYAAVSQDSWIQNSVHERCRIAIEEIVTITVQKCLDTNTQIPGSKDAMVALAFTNGWVKTVAQRNAEAAAALVDSQGQNETNTNV